MAFKDKPEKICFFMEQFGLGGTDVQLANLINHWPSPEDEIFYITNRENKGIKLFDSLLRRQCQKIVIDLKSYSYFNKRVPELNLTKISERFLKALLLLLKYPLFAADVVRFFLLISKFKFDILVSDNGGYPGSDSARAMVFACFICGIKKIFFLIHHKAERPARYFLIFEYIIDRAIQKAVDRIIAVSQATAKSLLEDRFFTGNIDVIHNGIEDKNDFSGYLDLREKYKIAEEKRIVGIMANIEPHKGHAVLIDAVPAILRECSEVHFLFIGSLYDESWHRLQADKVIELIKTKNLGRCVTMTGYLEGHPLDFIKQFDILVMPTTDFEGFGVVLVEAMLLKKPVVASKVGAIPEVIIDNVSGVLVPPSDPAELARSIIDLLKDNEKYNRISEQARKRYEQNFTAQIMAEKYFNLFTEGPAAGRIGV